MIDLHGFKLYLIEEELSENTIANYMRSMAQFAERYDEMTKANAIEFKQSFSSAKPKTINAKISAIEKYCHYYEIPIKLKRVKVHQTSSVENVISEDQYIRLISGLKNDGNNAWYVNVLVLGKTGARVSEAIKIKKSDVIRGYSEMKTKGKIRRIYIPKTLKNDIEEYIEPLNDSDTVVRGRFGSITARGVSQQLYNFAEKYDIPKEVMHAHSFRHFFAIEFLKRNNNISLLADLLGHSGVNTTMIYLRMSKQQQKEAIDNAVDW